jgi:tetratricopeptide (TPR) repeat protein
MRRGEIRSFVFLFLSSVGLLLLPAGCGSTGEPQLVDTGLQENIRQRVEQLERIRNYIAVGTPRALDIARSLLYRSDLENTEIGSEYAYIIDKIYHNVYPYLEYIGTLSKPPADSIYPALFQEVEAGVVPDIPQEKTSFLSSLAAATTIMNARDEAQIEKAGGISSYLVKINHDSILALLLQAIYLDRRKEFQAALDLYTEALRMDDSCYPARMGKVRMFYRQGRPEEAFEDVEILLQEFPEEELVLAQAVDIYLQSGRLQDADSLLSRGIIRYPDSAVFLRKRLELLERQEKFDQASRIARVLEQNVGETPETLLIRVQSLARQNRDAEALEVALKGMEKYPDYRRLSLYYGRLLVEMDRIDEAYSFYREELRQNPDDLSVVEALLETSMRLARWEDAALYAEELLRQRQTVDLYARAVAIYRSLGKTEEALEYAELSAEQNPGDPLAVETYLSLLFEQGQTDTAMVYIRRQQREERSPEVKSILLYYLARLSDSTEVKLQFLQSALLENIRNFNALRDIALLYDSLGEYNKAVRYLRQALALEPQNEELRKKLRQIEEKQGAD